jgi:hypothetical protein
MGFLSRQVDGFPMDRMDVVPFVDTEGRDVYHYRSKGNMYLALHSKDKTRVDITHPQLATPRITWDRATLAKTS